MRLQQAKAWLNTQGLTPAHILVLWCQGETDGDHAVTAEEYRSNFGYIWQRLQEAGAECCGLIQIGHFNRKLYPDDSRDAQYAIIRAEQLRITEDMPKVFLAGSFEPHEALMKDAFHYNQQAYNSVGKTVAMNVTAKIGGK